MKIWAERPPRSQIRWLFALFLFQSIFTLVQSFPFRVDNLRKRQILAPGPNPDWITGTYLGQLEKGSSGISIYNREKFTIKTPHYIPNHYQAQAHISNGYFGTSLPAVYGGFERDVNLTGTHQPVSYDSESLLYGYGEKPAGDDEQRFANNLTAAFHHEASEMSCRSETDVSL